MNRREAIAAFVAAALVPRLPEQPPAPVLYFGDDEPFSKFPVTQVPLTWNKPFYCLAFDPRDDKWVLMRNGAEITRTRIEFEPGDTLRLEVIGNNPSIHVGKRRVFEEFGYGE
jgi:hypothetical protein